MKTIIITFLSALFLIGCGYFSGGTWNDDPQNWERAFQSTKPVDVVVLHSRFWQSAHWSCEFEYFFEIKSNDQLKEQLFTQNKLEKLEGQEVTLIMSGFSQNAPDWFASKRVEQYEIWGFQNKANNHFVVLIDKETGNLFLTDRQL